MTGKVNIRDADVQDEAAWRVLWQNYLIFYEADVAPDITTRTWERIVDPNFPMIGRLAEMDSTVCGFTVSVLHEGSWVREPFCYLEDLFVDLACRGRGIGRMLIGDLVERAKAKSWSGLYWQTRHANPARKLYDEFVSADDFVRYRLLF